MKENTNFILTRNYENVKNILKNGGRSLIGIIGSADIDGDTFMICSQIFNGLYTITIKLCNNIQKDENLSVEEFNTKIEEFIKSKKDILFFVRYDEYYNIRYSRNLDRW